MDYALITQFNWGYRYGFNGIINGLDYHGNNNIDVYTIVTSEVPIWYREATARVFPFKVVFYETDEYARKYPPPANGGSRWILEFYKYKLAQELASEYKAAVIVDCDYMIGGNIENYLRVVEGSDVIMTANNICDDCNHLNEAIEEEYRNTYTKADYPLPIMNSPFFSDPKRNLQVFEEIYKYGQYSAEDIVPFNKGIAAAGKIKDLIILPGTLFFSPDYIRLPITRRITNYKRSYWILGEKLMMMHRHFWCREEIERDVTTSTATDSERRRMAWENAQLLITECEIINTQWKMRLNWEGRSTAGPLETNVVTSPTIFETEDQASKVKTTIIKEPVILGPETLSRPENLATDCYITEEEMKVLVGFSNTISNDIVELGMLLGGTAANLSNNRPDLIIWSVDQDVGRLENIYKELLSIYRNVFLVMGDTREIATHWERKIGLLLVDNIHDYTKLDSSFRDWSKWLVPNGIVALHDAAGSRVYTSLSGRQVGKVETVELFVKDLLLRGTWEKISEVDTMVFLKKKEISNV